MVKEEKKRRPRGRPRLTSEEKLKRKEAREAEKAKAKKIKKIKKKSKKKVPEIIKETKIQIQEKPEKLILTEEIEEVIQEIKLAPIKNSKQNSTLGLEELAAIFVNQTQILSDKINILEAESMALNETLKKLNQVSANLEKERQMLQQLNLTEQDLLYKNERKLIEIDQVGYQYRADLRIPEWVLKIIQLVTKEPNELIVAQNITKYKYKIQNRSEQLVQVDTELADVTLVILYNNNLLDTLKATIARYREVRVDIGQDFRTIRDFIKKNRIEIDTEQLRDTFFISVFTEFI